MNPEARPPAGREDLIFDWNHTDDPPKLARGTVTFDDETLRDGLQSASVSDPPLDEKIEILHLMEKLGIHSADVGLPAAGTRAFDDTLALVQETVKTGMRLRPNAAARTMVKDIEPIAEISQRAGCPVEVAMFIGSSPIRFYTESWEIDRLLRLTEEAVTFAVGHGLPVMFVTEDTTRATPDTVRRLYQTAIRSGAERITVADTVGHAVPHGVRAVLAFVRDVADEAGEGILIDWHGHNDRGLGVVNALIAALAGADQIHGTALGVGERCGNAAMDQILVNLKLMGLIDNDLSLLASYCERVSESYRIEIPCNYPVVGRDAFRTATGVHAAAVIKASRHGDAWLEDMIYSSVPASQFGREQIIEIGPMSGLSNVVFWLQRRGIEPDPELTQRIFDRAKQAKAVLEEEEILGVVREFRAG
jgi:2-isopropylmalate synthase